MYHKLDPEWDNLIGSVMPKRYIDPCGCCGAIPKAVYVAVSGAYHYACLQCGRRANNSYTQFHASINWNHDQKRNRDSVYLAVFESL